MANKLFRRFQITKTLHIYYSYIKKKSKYKTSNNRMCNNKSHTFVILSTFHIIDELFISHIYVYIYVHVYDTRAALIYIINKLKTFKIYLVVVPTDSETQTHTLTHNSHHTTHHQTAN